MLIEAKTSIESINLKTSKAKYGVNEAIKCRYLAKDQLSQPAIIELLKLLDEVNVRYLVEDFKNNLLNPIDDFYFIDLNTFHPKKLNEIVLFLNTNNSDRTTQGQEFHAHNLTIANDLEATITCAELMGHAKCCGLSFSKTPAFWEKDESQLKALDSLGKGAQLLKKLMTGRIRTRFGALGIEDGLLRMFKNVESAPNVWAFGSKK